MKIVFPGILRIFETEQEKVNVIVVENQNLLAKILMDIQAQIAGEDGETVVSEDNKVVIMKKRVELLSQFFPFSINQKSLIAKISGELEKVAVQEHYENTMEFLSEVETFFWDLSMELKGDIRFENINVSAIIKAIGVSIGDEYDTLCEALIDYMELVREYDKDKLFIILNLRSFVNDREINSFFDTILRQHYHVILLENCEHTVLQTEKRYIIDEDLCEIS